MLFLIRIILIAEISALLNTLWHRQRSESTTCSTIPYSSSISSKKQYGLKSNLESYLIRLPQTLTYLLVIFTPSSAITRHFAIQSLHLQRASLFVSPSRLSSTFASSATMRYALSKSLYILVLGCGTIALLCLDKVFKLHLHFISPWCSLSFATAIHLVTYCLVIGHFFLL